MKFAIAAVLLVGGVAVLAYLGMRSGEVAKPAISSPSETKPNSVAEQSYPCRIVPQQSVWASTQMTGPIEAVNVEIGQMVTDGQVLARVKSAAVAPALAGMEKDASADHVREVTAQLAGARAEAKRLQADAVRARLARARAEPVFRKQELLNQAGATPRLVFEAARAEYERAGRELAAAEEASRQADNAAARMADELGQAQGVAKDKVRASVAAVAGMDTAEIHAPAAGMVVERKIVAGDVVTEQNRGELFRIAVHPEMLRAEFGQAAGLRAGQAVAIRAGGVEIRAVMGDAGSADFESRLGAVAAGVDCSGTVRVK